MDKEQVFQQMVLRQVDVQNKKNGIEPLPHTEYKH